MAPSSQQENHDARLEALEQENAELRAELDAYRKGTEVKKLAIKKTTQAAWYLTAGPELNKALSAWLHTWVDEERVDVDQSADVLAAVVRRVFRVGTVGLLVALAPTVLLMMQLLLMYQQNSLIESQNTFFAEQNSKLERQVGAQEVEQFAARRLELVTLINKQRECPGTKRNCGFDKSTRDRSKAFMELAKLERKHNNKIDLTEVILSEISARAVDLRGARFPDGEARGVDFEGARMEKVYAPSANFANANLSGANLSGANLTGADLQNSILGGAKLEGAKLEGADLSRADLRKANLRGANLKDAELDDARLDGATYNAKTTWPKGFDAADKGALKK